MVGIEFEAIRIAMIDSVERQQAIAVRLQKLPEQLELIGRPKFF
jgi:hypothetical protein